MFTGSTLVQEALQSLGVPSDQITPDASLLNDLAIDSTEMIECIAIIEKKAGMNIDEKQLKTVKTVAELISYVESQYKPITG
jgi:acyl carrier protein